MPDFQEPSGDSLRRHQEQMSAYEYMMLHGMQAFRVADFQVSDHDLLHVIEPGQIERERVRQSTADRSMYSQQRYSPSLQHWEIRLGDPGLCQVNLGHCWLTFPLIEFSANRDTAIIRFTIPAAQFRAPIQTVLRLQEGDIFGDILEWRYHRDNGDLALNVTLRLHLSSFQMSAQPGEAVRYTFAVPISRYRGNVTREELLIEEQAPSTPRYNQEAQLSEDDSYYQRLERAGLLLDRLEALQELMQQQSISMPTADDQRALAEDWHYRRMERAGVFEELRQELGQELRRERSQPPIKQPTLCNGCRYLHGHSYGGTKLVCGVHPFGNGEDCSDFEAQ